MLLEKERRERLRFPASYLICMRGRKNRVFQTFTGQGSRTLERNCSLGWIRMREQMDYAQYIRYLPASLPSKMRSIFVNSSSIRGFSKALKCTTERYLEGFSSSM